MDELLNQAEIAIQLFKEALENPDTDKDLLQVKKKNLNYYYYVISLFFFSKDFYHQNKALHHRLIQQAWLITNDALYQGKVL
jgi:hypothetical protein